MTPGSRDPRLRAGAIVAACVLALALLVLAVAGGGADRQLRSTSTPAEPVSGPTTTPSAPSPSASPAPATTSSRRDASADHGLDLGPILRALLLLLIVALVVLGARWLWRWAPRPTVRVVESGGLDPGDVDPEELLEGAEDRRAALLEGEAGNAIVACWLDLEQSIDQLGMPRLPAETSTDLTRRLLTRWRLSPRHLDRLAALYREARFSRHDLHEGHREAALHHLDALHADLRLVAAERQVAPR